VAADSELAENDGEDAMLDLVAAAADDDIDMHTGDAAAMEGDCAGVNPWSHLLTHCGSSDGLDRAGAIALSTAACTASGKGSDRDNAVQLPREAR